MPRSVHSMMRHGLISTKAYNSTLAKTRSQKSKMADMMASERDEGKGVQRGKLKAGEIDQHEHQRRGTPGGKASRGGMVGGGAPSVGPDPHRQAQQLNRRCFPRPTHMTGKGNRSGPAGHIGVKGTRSQPGPMIGTGQK